MKRVLVLNLRRLTPGGQLAWLWLVRLLVEQGRVPLEVLVGRRNLAEPVREVLADRRFSRGYSWLRLRDDDLPGPDVVAGAFAYLSGSAVLSAKLVRRFSRLFVEPAAWPCLLEPRLYWFLLTRPDLKEELAAMMKTLAAAYSEAQREYEDFQRQLQPADRLVGLLTSVFNGDAYLKGFLANMAGLEQYDRCEHFLIRPGSSGKEHELLLAHARRWPGAVYINLPADPGLYEVWNLGARLATGRYLSNANLDDRRAPEHLTVLSRELEARPELAAAGTALRISQTPNLDWENSAACPTWFAGLGDLAYGGDGLIKETKDGLASRNLPHCMPVWRRELHACHGWFKERAYGPSADWEFWLRVGQSGGRFRHLAHPLGLYLKDESSYWRRENPTTTFDRRILAEYGHLYRQEPPPADTAVRPLGLELAAMPELARCGAWLEMVGLWLVQNRGQISNLSPGGDTVRQLLRQYGRHYFGVPEQPAHFGDRFQICPLPTILRFIIDLLHQPDWEGPNNGLAIHVLQGALVDGHVCSRDWRWLVALAFLRRRWGDEVGENALLQMVKQQNPVAFWSALADVYRFTVPLPDMVRKLGHMQVAGDEAAHGGKINLWYFPDYTRNAYQKLLYRGIAQSGGTVQGVKKLTELAALWPKVGRDNILHIHWLDAAWKKNATQAEFAGAAESLLGLIKKLKARGFKLYWTVHNELSHRCVDPVGERSLRRSFFELADRVYLHHPMVVDLVDWLSPDLKLRLAEHGNNGTDVPGGVRREAVRQELRLRDEDLLLFHFGQVRPYKDLQLWLPHLLNVLDAEPRLKFMLAGQVSTPEVSEIIAARAGERLIVRDEFVPEADLAAYGAAADFIFLSYRKILTSGTLFQAFTWGVPVIAPRLGTIPAYVADGWNGFTYGNSEELAQVVRRCLALSPEAKGSMAANARKTAQSLRWRFP